MELFTISTMTTPDSQRVYWELAKTLIEWVKVGKGEDVARYTDPEEGGPMTYGRILDTKLREGRNTTDRYRTSDGPHFQKKAAAKEHELENHVRTRLIEDGYVLRERMHPCLPKPSKYSPGTAWKPISLEIEELPFLGTA